MTTAKAAESLRTRCTEISRLITAMHPDVQELGDPGIQGEILRALYELTKQVEVVKKQVLRLQKGDASTTL